MSTQFALPCPACRKKHHVQTSQAGTSLKCKCGRTVNVPSMRDIRSLEPVAAQVTKQRPKAAGDWGVRQAISLAALLVGLCGLVGTAYLLATSPERPQVLADRIYELNEQQLDDQTKNMTVAESFTLWGSLEGQGIAIRLPVPSKLVKLRSDYESYQVQRTVALSITAIGLALAGVLWFWPNSTSVD